MEVKVSVKNLTKYFYDSPLDNLKGGNHGHDKKHIVAVDNINLDLKAGTRLGIIGQNGAGKSTFLAMLAGLLKLTSGAVEVTGKVTAIMTLGVGLKEELSGRENIYIDGELLGKSRQQIDAYIEDIIAFAELGDYIDMPVRTYSTGMKSRLSFSMLTIIEPEILIIDEALSAGDVFFARKASEKIKALCDKGSIVILVSHGMKTIKEMCNRCIWLEKGKIIADDSPETVVKQYLKDAEKRTNIKKLESVGKIKHLGDNSAIKLESVLITDSKGQSINTLYTGDYIKVTARLRCMSFLKCNMILTIRRIDDLLICKEEQPIVEQLEQAVFPVTLDVSFLLEKIYLAQSEYLLYVELLDDYGNCIASFSQELTIKTEDLPAGGRPILVEPIEIKQLSQGVNPCLDLTETMFD
jgi:ABC-type polysaccharide/polyol phosphate transport system ATPase subunit